MTVAHSSSDSSDFYVGDILSVTVVVAMGTNIQVRLATTIGLITRRQLMQCEDNCDQVCCAKVHRAGCLTSSWQLTEDFVFCVYVDECYFVMSRRVHYQYSCTQPSQFFAKVCHPGKCFECALCLTVTQLPFL